MDITTEYKRPWFLHDTATWLETHLVDPDRVESVRELLARPERVTIIEGDSGSGKTPFLEHVAARLNPSHVLMTSNRRSAHFDVRAVSAAPEKGRGKATRALAENFHRVDFSVRYVFVDDDPHPDDVHALYHASRDHSQHTSIIVATRDAAIYDRFPSWCPFFVGFRKPTSDEEKKTPRLHIGHRFMDAGGFNEQEPFLLPREGGW